MLSSLVLRASSSPGLAGVVREMLLEAADNISIRAGNESPRSLKFHNHGENVKAVVYAFNEEIVLVVAFFVIVKLQTSRRFVSNSTPQDPLTFARRPLSAAPA